jgi:hypothetical protein
MATPSLSEIRDHAVNTFKEWLTRHESLFFRDIDEKRNKTKQRQLKQLLNVAKETETSTSIPELLGFAFWVQTMLTMWGVNFGMGIVGEPVKSFHVTNAAVDEECSRRLAHALAAMLPLQLIHSVLP